jgi:hypothetical protein
MSARILNAQGILSSEVPTGNLLWVDAVNGIDALAMRGRMTIPFKTLAAAKSAAQSGDTIIVLPGTYNDSDLAKHGVNWHFLNGATVFQNLTNASLFYVNSAMTFRVTGAGHFSDGGSGNHILEVTNSSADVHFQGLKLVGTKSGIKMTAGASVVVEADWIHGDETSGIDIAGGILHVRARKISSTVLHGIKFTGGTATITATLILSESYYGVEYNNGYGASLTIRGARIESKLSSAGHAVNIVSTSNAIKLGHCVFKSTAGSAIYGPSQNTVYLHGECAANAAASGVTIGSGSPLNVNSGIA